jgi:hypothetical protein
MLVSFYANYKANIEDWCVENGVSFLHEVLERQKNILRFLKKNLKGDDELVSKYMLSWNTLWTC